MAGMPVGTTIRKLRKARGLTLNQLATLIESDVGNLSRLERNQQGYSDATLSKIAAALGVPVAALFTEPHDEPPDAGRFQNVEVVDEGDDRFVQVKKVKLRLSAGITGFQVEPEQYDGKTLSVPSQWVERRGYDREKLIAIRVRGESMEPTLYEDDLVVINTADTKPVDGQVFAVNYEGEPVIKRLARDAGRWWLTSDNSDQRKYHRKSCEGNECIIIGRVVRREGERF